jgi:hypothetical protein
MLLLDFWSSQAWGKSFLAVFLFFILGIGKMIALAVII